MKIMAAYKSGSSPNRSGREILIWPDSAMILSRKPLFLPERDNFVMTAVGARITGVGKSIREKFAGRYYSEMAPMAFILGRDTADCISREESPRGCDFVTDYSVVCGDFISKTEIGHEAGMHVSVSPLGFTEPQDPAPYSATITIREPLHGIDEAIADASVRNTLKTGDIVAYLTGTILTATPETLLTLTFDTHKPLLETKFK